MPLKLSYLIDNEKNLMFLKFEGNTSISDILNVSESLWADPDYNVDLDYIADIRNCSVHITGKDLINFAGTFRKKNPSLKGKGAVLVEKPIITAAVSVLAKKTSEFGGNICFSTVEGATNAMGIEFEKFLRFENDDDNIVVHS